MTDTELEFRKKQHEIVMLKPASQRIQEAFEMAEFARMVVLNRLRREHPEASESHLKAELFRIVYRNHFTEEAMNCIVQNLVSSNS